MFSRAFPLILRIWELGLAQLGRLWKFRHAPSSPKSFDQQYAGVHAAPQNVDIIPLILQSDRLRRKNLKVRVGPTDVTIGKNLERLLRGRGRVFLLLRFLIEDAQGSKIVLDLLKRSEC